MLSVLNNVTYITHEYLHTYNRRFCADQNDKFVSTQKKPL